VEWSGALLARREKDGERHPRWALAPGARALRRASPDGRNGPIVDVVPHEREIETLYRNIIGTCSSVARNGRNFPHLSVLV